MHEFTARFFTEQRLTGRSVSDAVPVPNNTLSVEVAFIADPISTAAIVVALLELSFDGGETWRFWMSTGGGSFPGGFGTGMPVGVTHARMTMEVDDAVTVTVIGYFTAPLGVEATDIVLSADGSEAATRSISVDLRTATTYVAANASVVAVDRDDNVVARIPIPGTNINNIAVNPVTGLLYAATNQGIDVVDAAAERIIASVAVQSGSVIGVNPVTNRIYLASGAGSLAVVDGANNTIIATIPIGRNSRGLAVNEVTNRIYVGSRDGDPIAVVDGLTNTLVDSISIEGPSSGIAVDTAQNVVYALNPITQSMTVIDAETNQIVDTLRLSGDLAVASVNQVTGRIYVGSSTSVETAVPSSWVLIVAARQHGETDGNNVRAAEPALRGNRFRLVGAVPTTGDAHGLAVSPETGRVYVSSRLGLSVFDDDFHEQAKFPNLSLTASPITQLTLGTVFTRTFLVSNRGPGIATTVKLRIKGPSVDSIVSVTPSTGYCIIVGQVECRIGDLGKHEEAVISLTVKPARIQTFSMVSFIAAEEIDLDGADNILVDRVSVVAP